MSTIADLLIRLGVDTKDADTKLAGFGAKASGALRKGFVPALAVLGGVGIMAKKVAGDASDLAESQNAVSVVFGKSAGVVHNFAKGAAKEAGLSMADLNTLVVPVGAGLRNVGFSADQAANSSVALARRAADMASVMNTSVPEALKAIQAGLRGEADPLERFGVGLNEAAVNAKAVSMGLAKTTAAVSPNAKAQARLALIMEQTSKYQGDFARTSGSVANKSRINEAEQANLTATMGKGLLPVMQTIKQIQGVLIGLMANHTTATKVAVIVITSLAAAVVAINVAMKLWTAIQAASTAATTLWNGAQKAAAVASKGWAAAQWLLNAAVAAIPIVAVVVLIAAFVAALVVAWRNSEQFRDIVNAVWNAVKAAATAFVGFFTHTIPAAFQAVKEWVAKNWPAIATLISGPFAPLVALATNAFGVRDAFKKGMTAMKDWASNAVSSIVEFFTGLPGKIKSAASSAGSAFVSGLGNGLSSLGSKLAEWVKAPINAVIRAWNGLGIPSFKAHIPMPGPVPDISFSTPSISLPDIPQLAKGGIVTKPTLALIGEAGPEAVVPLNNGSGVAPLPTRSNERGGPSVHVETMVVQDATDVDKIVTRLSRQLAMGMV